VSAPIFYRAQPPAPLLVHWVRYFVSQGFRPRLRVHASGAITLYRPAGW
jgi:hypothetical protein